VENTYFGGQMHFVFASQQRQAGQAANKLLYDAGK